MKNVIRVLAPLAAAVVCLPAMEFRGTVVGAFDRKPLKRAEVLLRPSTPGRNAVGVITDDQGQFAFFDVASGIYTLSVSRNGYLPTSAAYYNQLRLTSPFTMVKTLAGVVVRMVPACVVAGRVRHPDGEPAPGVMVEAYREYFRQNRHGYEVVGRARSDDRGEYRMFSLPPGRYYFAAVVVPFNGNDDVEEQWARDADGRRVPPERTVTTFLPSTPKTSDATQLALAAGDTVDNADIFLARSRTTTIGGRMLNGSNGQPMRGAAVQLLREDVTGTGYLPAHAVMKPTDRGDFEIRGVVPGAYVIEVRANERNTFFFARRPIVVGEAPSTTLEVLVQPEVTLRGIVYGAEREQRVPPGLRVAAEPRTEGPPPRSTQVERDGTFTLRLVAGQVYDIFLPSAPRNTYLKSASLDTNDVLNAGLMVPASVNVPLTLTIDERGAQVHGETPPGATVSLIPASGPVQRYGETTANEWGIFGFAAVAPGEYRVVPWFDEPPCDIWNPLRKQECSKFGSKLSIEPGSSHTLSIQP